MFRSDQTQHIQLSEPGELRKIVKQELGSGRYRAHLGRYNYLGGHILEARR
ncbi:MAG: hypothetical protein RIS24_1533 [Verrucomicrobiota bacterium]